MSSALDACPGVLTLHPARDGLVARIRLPGGYVAPGIWHALARLARDLGDGCVDVTARGNVQLRGLRDADADALANGAANARLLPSAMHDRARNITASPLAGLGGRPHLRALVSDLDAAMLADPQFAALPGRFLFAVDDGTGGAGLAACDIGLRHAGEPSASPAVTDPAPGDAPARYPGAPGPAAGHEPLGTALTAAPATGDFDLIVAGRLTGVRIPAADAVAAALAAARAALAAGVGASATRIAALADGGQSVAAAAGGAISAPVRRDTRLPPGVAGPETLAGWSSRPIGTLVVVAPLGRLTQEQIHLVVAMTKAREVIRIGIAGRVVIPVSYPSDVASRALEATGLIVAPDHPMADVTACSGAACHRSLADVRAAARPVSGYQKTHWAGCSRLCGFPPDAEPVVALDAALYRVGDREPSGEGAA